MKISRHFVATTTLSIIYEAPSYVAPLCAGVPPPLPVPRRAGAPPDGQQTRQEGEGGDSAQAAPGDRSLLGRK